jgi:HSP20 family molecular chaperone IbpA
LFIAFDIRQYNTQANFFQQSTMTFFELEPILSEAFPSFGPRLSKQLNSVAPCDFVDTNDTEFRLSLDVPGVKRADLEVTVDDDGLIRINGVRRHFSGGGVKKTRFARAFQADHRTVDLSEMKANLADGVLELVAPRKIKASPRAIEISSSPKGICNTSKAEKKEVSVGKGSAATPILVETVDPAEACQ